MSQSKRASLVEVVASTILGVIVAYVAQLIIFPLYDIEIDHSANIQIVFWFTLVSFARSYVMRRLWNSEWWLRVSLQTWVLTLEFLTLGAGVALALSAIHP